MTEQFVGLTEDDQIVLRRSYARVQTMLKVANDNGHIELAGSLANEEKLLARIIAQLCYNTSTHHGHDEPIQQKPDTYRGNVNNTID